MKKVLFGLLILASLCVIPFALTGCDNTGTITFEAGEYGEFEGETTVTYQRGERIVYPEVKAKEGYVFTGFSPYYYELPEKGDVTAKAQYVKVELWLADYETGDKLTDFDFEIPSFGAISYARAPKLGVKITDMQTGNVVEEGLVYMQFRSHQDSLKVESIAMDFEYVYDNTNMKIESNGIYEQDSSKYDWSVPVTLNVKCGADKDHLSTFQTFEFNVFKTHIRVTDIQLEFNSTIIDGIAYSYNQQPPKPGCIVTYIPWCHREDDLEHLSPLGRDFELVIDEIYSDTGESIDKKDFDLYAYQTGENKDIQLTDRAAKDWTIKFHVYYPKDKITSNYKFIVVS